MTTKKKKVAPRDRATSEETAIGSKSLNNSTAELVQLTAIKDGGAQMRMEMVQGIVLEYADEMLNGAVFPPVDVFFDGTDYWLGEGFHRVEAARKIEREEILANVREGTARDAILHGISANSTHGLRRSQADKRRAVERLLRDPEWARWTDRKIAEAAKVDHKTVGKIRRELSGEFPTGKSLRVGNSPQRVAHTMKGSLVDDLLRTLPDEALIAECRRRGLEVGHA